jgi:hypothetical protein
MKNERLKKFITGLVALLFGFSIIGFTIKLTYDVMAILFPADPVLRWVSIALYDGGVISWLTTYIARAKGTPQRGISLVMTVLDFLGVVAMVIGGIYLSGQTLADIPAWVGSAVVNVTIIAATLNAGAIYFFHASAPDVTEAIQAQELEDQLNEEALDQARFQVERKAQELGAIMANRVTARLKYRMRLPMSEREHAEWQGEIVDAQAYDPASLPPPPVQSETFWSAVKSFFGGKPSRQSSVTQPSKNSTSLQQEPQTVEQIAQTSDAAIAWQDMPDGSRKRYWCKVCRDEGEPWLYGACNHVTEAKQESQISTAIALSTLGQFLWEEDNNPNSVYENVTARQAKNERPEPSGMTRPSYNEASYHPVPMEGKEEYDI